MKINALYLLCFFFLIACNQKENKKITGPEKEKSEIKKNRLTGIHYNFTKADKVWEMPPELLEISGICFNKEKKILCHQDQNGRFFVFDLATGKIEQTVKFYQQGDYEDIAYNNDTVYVLRADGKIFRVTDYNSKKPNTIQINTFLDIDNNPEGLAFDKENNRLLVACKENSGITNAPKSTKAIYSVLLPGNKIQEEPAFVITKKDLEVSYGSKIEIDPSAIAIHPITKNIFIIGTRGEKVLVELLPNGTILQVTKLNNELFNQPEGITFDDNGDMYISNEGKNTIENMLLLKTKKLTPANILQFKYKNN